MRDYEWSQKTPLQRMGIHAFTGFGVIVFGYVGLAVSTGHLVTLVDMNWTVAWGVLKCIWIIALFPTIIFLVMAAFRAKYPIKQQHSFYREWACLIKGYGKGDGPVCFFVEDVSDVRFQRSVYKDKPIVLATIRFKPGMLGLRPPRTVAICADDEKAMRPIEDWLRGNQIMVAWDLPLESQRRS
jgi:hypothetical protein